MAFHPADKRPIRLAAIHLRARAAVDRKGRNARILQPQGYIDYVLRILVPAQTRLDGHGQRHGLHYAARHLDHQRHVAHHARSRAAPRYLLHGAAEIYIDKIGPRSLGYARRLHHRLDEVSVYLNTHGPLRLVDVELGARLPRIADQAVRRYELGGDHVGPEPLAHVAERRIGHILHRRQKKRLFPQIDIAYLHR